MQHSSVLTMNSLVALFIYISRIHPADDVWGRFLFSVVIGGLLVATGLWGGLAFLARLGLSIVGDNAVSAVGACVGVAIAVVVYAGNRSFILSQANLLQPGPGPRSRLVAVTGFLSAFGLLTLASVEAPIVAIVVVTLAALTKVPAKWVL